MNYAVQQGVLNQLKLKQPEAVRQGVDFLFGNDFIHQKTIDDAFDRAINGLRIAPSTDALSKVEASLQTVIDQAYEYSSTGKMDQNLASKYIFTAQNLIYGLGDWKFKNGAQNDYVPTIVQKYNTAMMMAGQLNVASTYVQEQCFTRFNNPVDATLGGYDYLDTKRLDKVLNDLELYRLKGEPLPGLTKQHETDYETIKQDVELDRNPETAPDEMVDNQQAKNGVIDFGTVNCYEPSLSILNKVVRAVTQGIGLQSMSTEELGNNMHHAFNMIHDITRSEDRTCLVKLAGIISNRVSILEKNLPNEQNMDGGMGK